MHLNGMRPTTHPDRLQMALFTTFNFVRVWAVAATTNSETAIFDCQQDRCFADYTTAYHVYVSSSRKTTYFAIDDIENVTIAFWTPLCDGAVWDWPTIRPACNFSQGLQQCTTEFDIWNIRTYAVGWVFLSFYRGGPSVCPLQFGILADSHRDVDRIIRKSLSAFGVGNFPIFWKYRVHASLDCVVC